MEKSKKTFLDLVSKEASGVHQTMQWRRENREWLKKSASIAIAILRILRERGMSQKDFASLMNVSPQQVNKIVKGTENLSLQSISKIEQVLGIRLIQEVTPQYEVVLPQPNKYMAFFGATINFSVPYTFSINQLPKGANKFVSDQTQPLADNTTYALAA